MTLAFALERVPVLLPPLPLAEAVVMVTTLVVSAQALGTVTLLVNVTDSLQVPVVQALRQRVPLPLAQGRVWAVPASTSSTVTQASTYSTSSSSNDSSSNATGWVGSAMTNMKEAACWGLVQPLKT